MKTGIELIAEERKKQIDYYGFNALNDACYSDQELAKAALCYLMPNDLKVPNEPLAIWPWSKSHYKPSPNDRIRELQKAGALIAAEIDRLIDLERMGPNEMHHCRSKLISLSMGV